MKETMIERIGRELWERGIVKHPGVGEEIGEAVLKILRDPPKPMVFYGMDAMCREDLEPLEADMAKGWNAMIDAALNETGQMPKEPA